MNEHKNKNRSTIYKYQRFGERLDFVMIRKNISNQDLAQKMYVSCSTISGYRTGRRSPNVDDLERLATVLDVSADYLIGRTDHL
jgi:transcriptional regulator with XRE-family HTH domain